MMFLRGRVWLALVVCVLIANPALQAHAEQITVVVYNVENLFDIDGKAEFDQYGALFPGDEPDYNAGMLLRKLDAIAQALATVNDGAGPDVIAFQEFEADLTPESTVEDYPAFLEAYKDQTVAQMLTAPVSKTVKGLPVAPLLVKRLQEQGLGVYEVAIGERTIPKGGRTIAHANAVFSRVPIKSQKSHPLPSARDMLEVTLDAGGHELKILNNHWKSGASDPKTEEIRVENARIVRARLDAILAKDPMADVLIVGDFNSYHNQAEVVREAPVTGIDKVLGSQSDESAVLGNSPREHLYNLWYDVPMANRFSEIWRGRQSGLMQMLVTPGLYDAKGVQYVDNSFTTVKAPGVNVDALGRPLRWFFAYGGGGASDHLPILVNLNIVGDNGKPLAPTQAEIGRKGISYWRPPADARQMPADKIDFSSEKVGDPDWWRTHIGKLVAFDGQITSTQPATMEIGGASFRIWTTTRSIGPMLEGVKPGASISGRGVLLATDNGLVIDIIDPDWVTLVK